MSDHDYDSDFQPEPVPATPQVDDGGPAFPCSSSHHRKGMTVRTWLIGQTLAGIDHAKHDSSDATRWAIAVADEVLAQTRAPAEKE